MDKLIIFALAGQLFDVLTTKVAVEKFGAEEANPLMRPLVEKGQFNVLSALKVGMVATVYLAPRNNKDRKTLLLMAGLVGLGAGLWNMGQMKNPQIKNT